MRSEFTNTKLLLKMWISFESNGGPLDSPDCLGYQFLTHEWRSVPRYSLVESVAFGLPT